MYKKTFKSTGFQFTLGLYWNSVKMFCFPLNVVLELLCLHHYTHQLVAALGNTAHHLFLIHIFRIITPLFYTQIFIHFVVESQFAEIKLHLEIWSFHNCSFKIKVCGWSPLKKNSEWFVCGWVIQAYVSCNLKLMLLCKCYHMNEVFLVLFTDAQENYS